MHGIPGPRVLRDGDVVSIDCGAILDGWHGDAAVTVAVGDGAPTTARELMRVTEESMWRGLAAARLGGRLTDIGHAVESYVRSQGDYGIVEEYGGHGIGTEMHQEPHVLNYGRPGPRPEAAQGAGARGRADGHTSAAGTPASWTTAGPWSPPTAALAAHFEHTVAAHRAGPGC